MNQSSCPSTIFTRSSGTLNCNRQFAQQATFEDNPIPSNVESSVTQLQPFVHSPHFSDPT